MGNLLLQRLLEDARYAHVVALTRRPIELEHPRLRVHITDFDALPDSAPDGHVDHAYCCLGTTRKAAGSAAAFRRVDLEYVLAFGKAAVQAGASHCILNSSAGAEITSRNLYLHTKGEAEAGLSALGFATVDVVRPGLLLGQRAELRVGERLGQWATPVFNPLLMGGLRRYKSISAETVAQAMAAAPWVEGAGVRVHHFDEMVGLSQRG